MVQAKVSLLSRVKGLSLGRVVAGGMLDGPMLGRGVGMSALGATDEEIGAVGGMGGSCSTIGVLDGVDESTLCLFWPQQLGRFPVLIDLDMAFLFSKEDARDPMSLREVDKPE